MPRILAAILLVAVLAIGGGLIATAAYQAGLGTAITTATGSAGTAVTPVVVPAYGYGYGPGWHPGGFGFGFFGFLGDPVLPVHRVRADPGDLLARRPGPARLGTGGWGGYGYGKGPDGAVAAPGRATPTTRSTTGTAAPTASTAPPDSNDQAKPTGTA